MRYKIKSPGRLFKGAKMFAPSSFLDASQGCGQDGQSLKQPSCDREAGRTIIRMAKQKNGKRPH